LNIDIASVYRDIYTTPTQEAVELALKYGYLPYMVQRYIDMLGLNNTLKLLEAFEKELNQ